MSQVFAGNADNIPSACEPCMSVSDAPFGLQARRPKPLVREGEARTTMVVLLVVDSNRASVPEDRAILRHAVRNSRENFRQVQGRVGVMTDPEKEHLPVQVVHTTHRACGDMRRKGEWVGSDPGGLRSGYREGVAVIASQYAG